MTIREVKMPCPYYFCRKEVHIHYQPPSPFAGGKESWLIENHDIDHRILRGLCPASLMHWPLDKTSNDHLNDQQRRDMKYIASQVGKTVIEDAKQRGILPAWKRPQLGIIGGKMSVQEIASALNEAAIKVGEVRGVVEEVSDPLGNAVGSVEEALRIVQGAKGDIESETLNAYISALLRAKDDLERARASVEDAGPLLGQALELGEEYVNRLHG